MITQMQKTYPPDVEAQRQMCLEAIRMIDDSIYGPYQPQVGPQTAIPALAKTLDAARIDALHRQREASVRPWIDRLANLEVYAAGTYLLPSDSSPLSAPR